MSEKDFLSQLAEESKKPDSFKEEERVPIQKEKKPIKPWMIIVPIVLIVIIAFSAWFFLLRATIEMPNFVSKTQNDVAAWVRQYGIQSSGVIFDESYSMDYDEGVIMSQSVQAGTKVKEDVKVNFGLSLGPDPDEQITVPDLENMNREEILDWVDENKLLSTKVITAFSNTVAENGVIEVEFRNCDRDNFTRGCSLNVTVSKGQAPAGTVTVQNFVNQDVASVESWANQNKVELVVTERYDDNVAANLVISQSVEANKTLKEGETLTIVVSKGEGVLVPNFADMARSEIDAWLEENATVVTVKERYSTTGGYIIAQSVKSGGRVGPDDKLELTVNMGDTFYLAETEGGIEKIVGTRYSKLVDWCNDTRELGIDAYAGQWTSPEGVYSTEYDEGTIVSVKCLSHDNGKEYDCGGRLPLDVRFDVVVSKGRMVPLEIDKCTSVAKLVQFLSSNNVTFVLDEDVESDHRAIIKDSEGHSLDQSDYIYTDQIYTVSSSGRKIDPGCTIEPVTTDQTNALAQ